MIITLAVLTNKLYYFLQERYNYHRYVSKLQGLKHWNKKDYIQFELKDLNNNEIRQIMNMKHKNIIKLARYETTNN